MHPVLANAMRLQALRATGEDTSSRLGTVTSYDPNSYSIVATIQPENIKTGALPLASPWVGNQWGLFCPPSIGDLVDLHFIDSDLQAGFAVSRFYTNDNRPLKVDSGEFWIVHQTGSFLKFHNDGTVELTTNSDLTVSVGGDLNATVDGDASVDVTGDCDLDVSGDCDVDVDGDLTATADSATINADTQINGDLVVSGSIEDQNGAKGTVQHIRDVYDTHVHPGVQTGGGSTGATTQTL